MRSGGRKSVIKSTGHNSETKSSKNRNNCSHTAEPKSSNGTQTTSGESKSKSRGMKRIRKHNAARMCTGVVGLCEFEFGCLLRSVVRAIRIGC